MDPSTLVLTEKRTTRIDLVLVNFFSNLFYFECFYFECTFHTMLIFHPITSVALVSLSYHGCNSWPGGLSDFLQHQLYIYKVGL